MHMSYYLSSTVYDFFFKGANITTTWGMVSLCLGLMSLSVVMEGFKVARSQLVKLSQSRRLGTNQYGTSERVKFHVLQAFLHLIHLTIGYLLMLAVMSYNGYFTIAVVGGAGIGYFCFALLDLPGKLLGTATPAPARSVPAHEDFLNPSSSDKTCALLPEKKNDM
ncbi:high affinity copper uptake protein 1-like isoform X2 [Palaemon carinicauda]